MPTLLRQFPRVSRSGTQETAYAQLPDRFDFIQLLGDASNATLSNVNNAIRFEVLHSVIGDGSDERIIQVEEWTGGTFIPKGGSTPVPRQIDITFGPIPDAGSIALRATFKDATTGLSRTMTMGATLTGLP